MTTKNKQTDKTGGGQPLIERWVYAGRTDQESADTLDIYFTLDVVGNITERRRLFDAEREQKIIGGVYDVIVYHEPDGIEANTSQARFVTHYHERQVVDRLLNEDLERNL